MRIFRFLVGFEGGRVARVDGSPVEYVKVININRHFILF